MPNPHTNEWIFSPDYRAKACAALWALLRSWSDTGMPLCADARKPSFEAYASIVGSVVVAAGLANPFASFDWPMGGDEAGRALQTAICRLAGALPSSGELTTDEVLDRLREDKTHDVVLPFAKNADGERKSLGHKLTRLRGRVFTDTRGRRFEFGKRGASAGSRYVIAFLDQAIV